MSFLDESDFDSKNRTLKTNYDDDDDDLSNQFGNRVNLGTPSGGRARMLAQEREKQLKRRQNAAQSEGSNCSQFFSYFFAIFLLGSTLIKCRNGTEFSVTSEF